MVLKHFKITGYSLPGGREPREQANWLGSLGGRDVTLSLLSIIATLAIVGICDLKYEKEGRFPELSSKCVMLLCDAARAGVQLHVSLIPAWFANCYVIEERRLVGQIKEKMDMPNTFSNLSVIVLLTQISRSDRTD